MRPLSVEEARRLEGAALSYDVEDRRSRRLRYDLPLDADPESALDRLLTWQMHEGAGISVRASARRVAPGVVAVLRPGVGPLRLRAPVRVIRVDDVGFTYGTLPGHPESGEERFEVVPDGDRCRLVVTGFSQPGRLLTRAAGPLARLLQDEIVRRYARALCG